MTKLNNYPILSSFHQLEQETQGIEKCWFFIMVFLIRLQTTSSICSLFTYLFKHLDTYVDKTEP